MMTVKREVVPCEERLFCDCDGEMISTGNGITQMRTTWQHRCTKCQREAWLTGQYPRITHVPCTPPAHITSADTYVLGRGERIVGEPAPLPTESPSL